MHDTAFQIGSKFIDNYTSAHPGVIVEFGALDVNGSLRGGCPKDWLYLGLDVESGKGVDVAIDPSLSVPLSDGCSDITITTSQMEHDNRFWMTFLELCRVTKTGGMIYFSAPSNGTFHRYPVDVWRFYPDAGHALAAWAQENKFEVTLLESFIAPRQSDIWNDFVAIFYMGQWEPSKPIYYLADHFHGLNVWKLGFERIENLRDLSEEQELLRRAIGERDDLESEVRRLKGRIKTLQAKNKKSAQTLGDVRARLNEALSAATLPPPPGENRDQ